MNRIQRDLVASKRTGTRKVYGTDWPIENAVYREQRPGRKKPYWVAYIGLCDVDCHKSRIFETRTQALQWCGLRGERP